MPPPKYLGWNMAVEPSPIIAIAFLINQVRHDSGGGCGMYSVAPKLGLKGLVAAKYLCVSAKKYWLSAL